LPIPQSDIRTCGSTKETEKALAMKMSAETQASTVEAEKAKAEQMTVEAKEETAKVRQEAEMSKMMLAKDTGH